MSRGDALGRLRSALEDHGSVIRGSNAQCPAHDDRQASLSIGQGRDGAVVKCHANCATDAVLEALGMSAGDLFDEPRAEGNGHAYQVAATYAYTDENGHPLFYAERRMPKGFRQYHVRDGQKVWNLTGVRRVLYRLPQVIAAVEAGQEVWIAEGEKDVHALETAGVTATCNPMGAGKWLREYADVLKGATVVVVADRDEAGYAHARQICDSLAGNAASVRVVHAAIDRDKADASDHLAAGLGLDAFQAVPSPADAALRYAADVEKNRLRARQLAEAELLAEASRPAPPPVRLDHLLAEPDEPLAYRIDRLWPAGGRVILAAQRKAGKTTTVANLLRCLADGDAFLGRYDVTPPGGPVFAIDTEMSRRMLRDWLAVQKIGSPGRIHIEPLRGAVSSFNILDPARRAEWAETIRGCGATILVLDCIGPVLAGLGLDENSALDTGRFLGALEELLADAGVTEAVIVHHMGHLAERSRGASRLRDWPDAEWKLVYEIADGEQDAGPAARRYFSAAGRDVAEPEQLLDYDAASRRLSIAGGTRRDEKNAAYLAAIVAYITSHPEAECSKTRVEQAVEGRAADIRKVLAEAVAETGPLCVHDGSRNARLHRIRSTCAEHSSTPSHPVQGVLGTEFSTPSTPIGDGVLNGAPGQERQQDQRDGVEP